jgi:hypothetical protein
MRRVVRTLLRLIAAGLMVFGVLEMGLEYMKHLEQVRQGAPPDSAAWRYAIGAVLLGLGAGLMAGSGRLAEKLTDDSDE